MLRNKNKDIGLKVVSNEEAFWIKAKENVERSIKEHEDVLKIDKAVLEKFEEMRKQCTHT